MKTGNYCQTFKVGSMPPLTSSGGALVIVSEYFYYNGIHTTDINYVIVLSLRCDYYNILKGIL